MTMTTSGRAGPCDPGTADAAAAAMALPTGLGGALAEASRLPAEGALAPLALLQATVITASAAGATTHAPPLPPGSLAR
jgi:hypothetical protein